MAALSQTFFALGVIIVALGFAAHVGHAVMLANGRRLVSLAPARQPAFAGVVTGSVRGAPGPGARACGPGRSSASRSARHRATSTPTHPRVPSRGQRSG